MTAHSYDTLGHPLTRSTARNGQTVNDTFTHNNRSELVEAQVNGSDYEYAYDNIGNRQFALEDNTATMYDTNALNQYTAIAENGATDFVPQFDADGNQTLIKTSTGIWSAVYNAENRPINFTNRKSNTVVECVYDYMGRRSLKKVSVNGNVAIYQRYIYRGYLQIACLDLTLSAQPALWFITWDPTHPIDTRPLAIQLNNTWYTYSWDINKNVCELFGPAGYIRTTYSYTPYGSVTSIGDVNQPIQWSSEFCDEETGLKYYNFRYLDTKHGRWINRDPLANTNKVLKLYIFANNNAIVNYDRLGLIDIDILSGITDNSRKRQELEESINMKVGVTNVNITLGLFANRDFTNEEEDINGCKYNVYSINGGVRVGVEVASFANKINFRGFQARYYAGFATTGALSLGLSGKLFSMKDNPNCKGGRICFLVKAKEISI